eukprot:4577503-Amphidinium_carterae.1
MCVREERCSLPPGGVGRSVAPHSQLRRAFNLKLLRNPKCCASFLERARASVVCICPWHSAISSQVLLHWTVPRMDWHVTLYGRGRAASLVFAAPRAGICPHTECND